MRGLRFFRRTSARHSYNIAAYHDPRSLTWSWLVSISFDSWSRRLTPGPLVGRVCQQVWLRIPFVCSLHFQWQRKMFINPARS